MKDVFGEEVLKEDWDFMIESVKTQKWTARLWTPRHALLRPDGAIVEFIGQDYDARKMAWLEHGWTEDRCELRGCTLVSGDAGMTPDGRNWMCDRCYELCKATHSSCENRVSSPTRPNSSGNPV
ncbi:MAG: hypothetical protein ABJN69_08150 [Hellea sp.]